MRALSDGDILDLWDRGAARSPLERPLFALGAALPETPLARIADWPLGRRNKALLELRCACFGPRVECWLGCARCGEKLEFSLDGRALASAGAPWEDDVESVIKVGARAFALPTSRHLAAAIGEADASAAAAKLLRSCCLDPDPPQDLSELELEEIGEKMALADPLAETRLSFQCPQCAAEWEERFDVGAFLWAEIETVAKALLATVHALASAYGWSEASILSLSPRRRAHYLAMARP